MNNLKHLSKRLPLGRLMATVTRGYIGALTKRLEGFEIERYYSVLILIEANPGCSQQDVADILKMDKVSMARVMESLIRQGYIHRLVNPEDRRAHQLALSPKAERLMPELHAAVAEVNKSAFAGFDKSEQEQFMQWLFRIRHNLDELPAERVFITIQKGRTKNVSKKSL